MRGSAAPAEGLAFALDPAQRATTAVRNETDLLPSFSLLASRSTMSGSMPAIRRAFVRAASAVDGNFCSALPQRPGPDVGSGNALRRQGPQPDRRQHHRLSYSRWRTIQADFIDSNGFPTTANIGDGRITSLSGAVAMRPTDALTFELGGVYNHSRVDDFCAADPAGVRCGSAQARPHSESLRKARSPGSVNFATVIDDEDFRVNGWASYIGPSRLGIGPVLGESRGDYVDTGLAMRIGNARRGLSLTLTNLFDLAR